MTRLRACLCDGCPGYGDCWNGGDNRAPRLLCDLAALAVEWSDTDMSLPLFGEGVPHDIARRCRRSRQLADRVGEALEDFARTRRAQLRRGDENRLISAQFLQARKLIDALAAEQARPILHRLAREGYAIVYLTEQLAAGMAEDVARYKDELAPAIILIPGKEGSLGIGMANIKTAVERAVGADIL
jgi:V/A-type H+-transporting ATPase subunit F